MAPLPEKMHISSSTLNCSYSFRELTSLWEASTGTQAENSGPRLQTNQGKQTHFSNDFETDKGEYLRIGT